MKHELITLPYSANTLEPVISADTISYHHGKHLQAYVNTLNQLIEGNEFAEMSLEDIVRKAEGKMFNQAGQVMNHNYYFLQFQAPQENNKPSGRLADAIVRDFGSFEAMVAEMSTAANTLFGAGWAWLSAKEDGTLVVGQYPNAGNPLREGLKPILCIDVWEHAYYLGYQNRRPDHVGDLWSIINWEVVADRY